MYTIHFSAKELETTRQGMTAFLQGFSHDEPDVIHAIRSVLQQLAAAEKEQDAATG